MLKFKVFRMAPGRTAQVRVTGPVTGLPGTCTLSL